MILFAITSFSELMLDELFKADNPFVLTTRKQVSDQLDELNISNVLLDINNSVDDVSFRELAMPGIFSDKVFPNTSLSVADVLSIDRLRFWYNSECLNIAEFIKRLSFDKLVVSLDLGEQLPMIALNDAMSRDVEVIAVKTEAIKTREMYDIAVHLNIDEFIVESREDEQFLRKVGVKARITTKNVTQKEVEYPERLELRKGLGITEREYVTGVIFDKRDEFQCRKFLGMCKGKILIFPFDYRSNELIRKCLINFMDKTSIYTDLRLLAACDRIIAFRYDETMTDFPLRADVVDWYNMNKSKEIGYD